MPTIGILFFGLFFSVFQSGGISISVIGTMVSSSYHTFKDSVNLKPLVWILLKKILINLVFDREIVDFWIGFVL